MQDEAVSVPAVVAGDEMSKTRRRRIGKVTGCLPSASCFRVADNSSSATVDTEGGTNAGSVLERRKPTHLVVMINGIVGSAGNWSFAAKQFKKKHPDDIVVYCSECNSGLKTLDGVDKMGERLAKEIKSVVEQRPELEKISLVAHSLGGLVARYAIALLYEKKIPANSSHEKNATVGDTAGVLIAGLEPMNFITFATPHLGSRFHRQIPMLSGFHLLENMAPRLCWIARRSGRHLFLKDRKDGNPPLLLQMVTDFGDLKFMTALRSFKRHVAYSNARFDFIVGWKTSSIRRKHELPERRSFTKNETYPHVVNVEMPKDLPRGNLQEITIHDIKSLEMEEVMIKGLNTIPWQRVDVCFEKTMQRIFAHSTIQVKTYFLNSSGADVILHMIDHLLK